VPLASIALVVILTAPVLGGVHSEPASMVFAPVPDHGARLEPSNPRATGVIVDLPVRPVRDGAGPDVEQPSPQPIRAQPRSPRPGGGHQSGSRHVTGTASWYCGHGSACHYQYPGGLYAAAGPALRVGNWRGRTVEVRANGRMVRARLIDFCACPHRLIDLYSDAFVRLAPLSRGVLKVSVTW
jgi:rare lipoprotein A (peptidoglycan hydrolase)